MAQSAQGRAGPSPERAGLAEVRAVHRGPSFSRLLLVPAVTRRGPWVVWGTAAAEGAGTKCSQNQFWALGRGGHGDSRLCSRRMGRGEARQPARRGAAGSMRAGCQRVRLTGRPLPACTPASPWRRAPGSPRTQNPRAPSPTSGAAAGGRSTRARFSAPAGRRAVRGRACAERPRPLLCTCTRAFRHTRASISAHAHTVSYPRAPMPSSARQEASQCWHRL